MEPEHYRGLSVTFATMVCGLQQVGGLAGRASMIVCGLQHTGGLTGQVPWFDQQENMETSTCDTDPHFKLCRYCTKRHKTVLIMNVLVLNCMSMLIVLNSYIRIVVCDNQ